MSNLDYVEGHVTRQRGEHATQPNNADYMAGWNDANGLQNVVPLTDMSKKTNKPQYTIRWFDAEWHTAQYGDWARCQVAIKTLVRGGMKVEITFG